MTARLARFVLALALLAGWQLALVHPLKHLDSQGSYVHLGDDHSHDRKPGSTDGLCDVIAALAACAPDTAAGQPPLCCGLQAADSLDFAARLSTASPPFLSQGPPVLL
ncbi:MAG TPA: hypothetical protein VFZ84_08075 [Burkholderiales bacterium]